MEEAAETRKGVDASTLAGMVMKRQKKSSKQVREGREGGWEEREGGREGDYCFM